MRYQRDDMIRNLPELNEVLKKPAPLSASLVKEDGSSSNSNPDQQPLSGAQSNPPATISTPVPAPIPAAIPVAIPTAPLAVPPAPEAHEGKIDSELDAPIGVP